MALLVATPNEVVRIADTADPVLSDVDVRCIAVDGSAAYAGTQGHGVFRSLDGGRNWAPAGLDGHSVKAIETTPAAPGCVWAATKPPRLFRSGDRASTWAELPAFAAMRRPWWLQPAEKPHTAYVSTLAVSPVDPDVIVAGIEAFKLLRSSDGGRSWSRLGHGVAWDAHEVAFHPHEPNRVFLAAGFGASRSDDAGASWTKVLDGLDRRYGFCLAPDPADPASVFMAAAPVRTAHTANAHACVVRLTGGRWETCRGLPDDLAQLPYSIAASANDVYVGLGDGTIWHSADAGASWTVLDAGLDGLRRLAISDA